MNEAILNIIKNQIGFLILIPLIIFILKYYLTELFANRDKQSRRKLWINFLFNYNKCVSKCILQFENIKKPKDDFSLFLLPFIGGILGYLGPIILLYVMLKLFTDVLNSIAISIFLIFLIGFIFLVIIDIYIEKIYKSEKFLDKIDFVISSLTVINWFLISSSVIVILLIYLLYMNINKSTNHDLIINLLSFAFLFWFIIIIFSSKYRRDLLNHSKELLNTEYFEKFPCIYVKTTSNDFKGKICDVFDKNLIVLDNNGDKRVAEWHSISYMELIKPEELKEKIKKISP
ncbi:MAG: hypothetical protein KAT05_16840 [Spirochaetes bacterium]|nr:hypothetical protein [Spirochaetota bacterium]